MQTKMIEATNGFNWGKFMVGRFTEQEWAYRSSIGVGKSLLTEVGWTPDVILVCDLQTGEGAILRPRGLASADLIKHRIWVCPMFEPFLEWLYEQDLTNLDDLLASVDLKGAKSAVYGYRRPGVHQFVATPTEGLCASCGGKRSNSVHRKPEGGW